MHMQEVVAAVGVVLCESGVEDSESMFDILLSHALRSIPIPVLYE